MLSDETRDGGFTRQRFLHALIAAGMLPGLMPPEAATQVIEPLAFAVSRGSRTDVGVVESYTMITAEQRELYWTTPADTLRPSALAHIQLGVHLLRNGEGEVRRQLAGSLAASALLGARLAFFDLRQVALAEWCFDVATAAVRESGDHALAAAVQNSLSTHGEDPEWLDFFDPARLASFLGYIQLVAGRTADAVVSLDRALDRLDDRAGKQRSVVLLDLAAARATTEAEHAMDLAAQAFDQLEREPYGAAHDRIPALRQALENTPQARVLDERIRSLPAAHQPQIALCSRIRPGSSASPVRRNRHRLLTASSTPMYPHGPRHAQRIGPHAVLSGLIDDRLPDVEEHHLDPRHTAS